MRFCRPRSDQVPACGPGLEYLLETFPLMDALRLVFEGSGECAEVQWTFLGLSIPGWTLTMILALAAFGLLLLFETDLSRSRGAGSRISARL